jgi:hypothetical protein
MLAVGIAVAVLACSAASASGGSWQFAMISFAWPSIFAATMSACSDPMCPCS